MTPGQLLRSVVDDQAKLTFEGARILMSALLQGDFSEPEMFSLLQAYHWQGETAAELAGFADAMRSAAVLVPLTDSERELLVDTCGTGGDGSGTFNISTAAALVACAAGAQVAKHGNRAITSRCGSADVLDALGIRTDHTPESAAESIRQHGFAFLLATRMHPAMKIVAPVRRALPYRTIFNLLGPMTNPAGARRQVMGVFSLFVEPLVAEAIATGGHMAHAIVVNGAGKLDELSLDGKNYVHEIKGRDIRKGEFTCQDAGLQPSDDKLSGGDARENALILQQIFGGEPGPRRDTVLLNAAAVLIAADRAKNLREGVSLASEAIDTGQVKALVLRLQVRQ